MSIFCNLYKNLSVNFNVQFNTIAPILPVYIKLATGVAIIIKLRANAKTCIYFLLIH